jgi:hypothetical protein
MSGTSDERGDRSGRSNHSVEPRGAEANPEAGPGPRVIRLPLLIRRDDVVHFLGYPAGREPLVRIADLIDPVLLEARGLASAKGTFLRLPVEAAGSLGLEAIDAAGLVVGLVTAGDRIEKRVSEYLENGDGTRALVLDAAGSAAVEEAADHLGAIVASEDPDPVPGPMSPADPHSARTDDGAAKPPTGVEALPLSCRISPGYGAWPLGGQRALFDLIPHERLGVTLLPSMLMVPRKSISFAMWLGADARPLAGLSGCDRCRLTQCRYRRQTK